jgi:hypothetical protein
MDLPSYLPDNGIEKGTCVACGASLANRPATVTVFVRPGSARETTLRTCRCGAICRFERVRSVSYNRFNH